MQPNPPPRRRRRAGRAAGPPGPAIEDTAPAAAAAAPADGAPVAPVVPPAPPPADARRPSAAPGIEATPGARSGPGETGRAPRWSAGPRRRAPRDEQGERALRALVTLRGSQVSPPAAMRAREVEIPTADDLAAAEREVVLVRRNYVPPTALPTGRRSGSHRTEPGAPDRRRPRDSGA